MSKILTSNIEIDFTQKVWKSDQIKLESFDEQRIGKPKTTARLVRILFYCLYCMDVNSTPLTLQKSNMEQSSYALESKNEGCVESKNT